MRICCFPVALKLTILHIFQVVNIKGWHLENIKAMYGKMRSLLEEDNKERLLKQLYSNFYCFKKYNNYGNSKGNTICVFAFNMLFRMIFNFNNFQNQVILELKYFSIIMWWKIKEKKFWYFNKWKKRKRHLKFYSWK